MNREELIEWLSKALLMQITEQTVFLDDLGLAGMDIDTFFIEFIQEFNIDGSLLNLSEYTLEGCSLLDIWLKGKKAKKFKLDHLEKVILLRKWYDPDVIDKYI
jgi:hypothetical protein